ncbi:MAG: hypothetical protein WBW56_12500 [Syntrophobacteraceae bacterium]
MAVKVVKQCPIIGDTCWEKKCAWFGKDNCAVYDIADELHRKSTSSSYGLQPKGTEQAK